MGMLDFLINQNKEPKEGMEYIYLHDMVFIIGKLDSVKVKYGSIVTDVVKLENDSFEFTLKEDGKSYCTNYGWSLAENTPENLDRINAYLESDKKLEKLKKETYKLRNLVIDLDGPKRI